MRYFCRWSRNPRCSALTYQRRHWTCLLCSAAQAPLSISDPAVLFVAPQAALPCPGHSSEPSVRQLCSLDPRCPLPSLRGHRQLCSRRSPLLHKCRLQQPLVYSAPAPAAPALPGSSASHPGIALDARPPPARPGSGTTTTARPARRSYRAPQPLTFNSRVPLPRAALPRHRAGRQAPAWLCRGSWCWPGQRPAPRWEPLPALHLFCLYKLLTSFCLAWQAPGPSLPLFTASFKKWEVVLRAVGGSSLSSPWVSDLLLKFHGCAGYGFVIGAGVLQGRCRARAVPGKCSQKPSVKSVGFIFTSGWEYVALRFHFHRPYILNNRYLKIPVAQKVLVVLANRNQLVETR